MHYIFLDFETAMTKKVSLKRMTLRRYLSQTHVIGLSFALDDGEVQFTPTITQEIFNDLEAKAESEDWTFVAHNAAFDIRVLRHLVGLPQPTHVLCSLELSCAAFPNQAGGYSLDNLARTLNLGTEKLKIDLLHHTADELEAYCKRDTALCRALFKAALSRLHPDELRVALLANQVRELWLDIDATKVNEAFASFSSLVSSAAVGAIATLGEGAGTTFGLDGTMDGADVAEAIADGTVKVRSVKPHILKSLLLENLGFETQSISRKKINPERLRAAPKAAEVIGFAERANKALSHQRRVRTFLGVDSVDVELGYYRATNTGRFSSPAPGSKGINLHNMSKRDKVIAKALRSIFRWPEGLCIVRADFANVEYRIEGMLTRCEHTANLFGANILADPYLAFGNAATGRTFTKADPIRQMFKAAVLGLGFLMGHYRFTEELLKAVADPANGLSLDDLRRVCADMHWEWPKLPGFAKGSVTRLRCPQEFGIVAYQMREAFHRVHPEFGRTARWIDATVARLVRCLNPDEALAQEYDKPNAPDRNLLRLEWAGDRYGRDTKSVVVYCGHWPQPTVVWRDIAMRECLIFGKVGFALTAMHAKKGYRPLTLNLYIENVIQSAARNALCCAMLKLGDRYPYQFSVHDELMLVVRQQVDAVLRARADLLSTLGPGNDLGWDWSVVINPEEINVSKSLYEVNQPASWWEQLAAGNHKLLEELP